jgi:hypothetical protein
VERTQRKFQETQRWRGNRHQAPLWSARRLHLLQLRSNKPYRIWTITDKLATNIGSFATVSSLYNARAHERRVSSPSSNFPERVRLLTKNCIWLFIGFQHDNTSTGRQWRRHSSQKRRKGTLFFRLAKQHSTPSLKVKSAHFGQMLQSATTSWHYNIQVRKEKGTWIIKFQLFTDVLSHVLVDSAGDVNSRKKFRFVADDNGTYKKSIALLVQYSRSVFLTAGTICETLISILTDKQCQVRLCQTLSIAYTC